MYLLVSSFLIYVSSVHCANILGVFMVPSISHQIVYQPIWRELSLRGHTVTVVTPDPLNDPSLTNLTEISIRFAYKIFEQHTFQEAMSKDLNMFQVIAGMYQMADIIAETELSSPEFQELLHDEEQHFDLILLEYNPIMFALGTRFKAPVIALSPLGTFSTGHDIVGNPNHPVLYPEHLIPNFSKRDLTLWQKVKSAVFNLWMKYYHRFVLLPRHHEIAKKYFGDGIPYVGDLERNASMFFLNVNPLLYPSRSNVPAVLEMGQMHIKPIKPLPRDLKQILDNATEGAIFFSLGSNVKTMNLDDNLRSVIIRALSELPYTVLMKWETDHLCGEPSNIITRKWFPQQDLLGHPNVRAFVTQGGLQSIEEAITRRVPLVGLPFLGDQPTNIRKVVDLGIGVGLDAATLTKNQLKTSILEVVRNKHYRRRISGVYEMLYDKPMSGLQKAVWWSEYVIKHGGAGHLRSPQVDMSFYSYLLADVGFAVVVIGGVLSYVGYKITRIPKRKSN